MILKFFQRDSARKSEIRTQTALCSRIKIATTCYILPRILYIFESPFEIQMAEVYLRSNGLID